jgi:hypothetical protein
MLQGGWDAWIKSAFCVTTEGEKGNIRSYTSRNRLPGVDKKITVYSDI